MTSERLVVIGGSWGGMRAAATVLAGLTTDFPLPIVIAQHRGADSHGDSMADYLAARSPLPVKEAEDKDAIESGFVYLAPADYHLLVDTGSFALSTDERIQFSRPSIDVLFESTAASYGARAIGVLLTGANEDGARGLASMKRSGALTIVQDPSTADRTEMPRAAIRLKAARLVLPLDDIGPRLMALQVAERRGGGIA